MFCDKNKGFSLVESLLVIGLLLTFLLFIFIPLRYMFSFSNHNVAAQRIIIDLQSARASSRLSGQPLVFSFTNYHYSAKTASSQVLRDMPFAVSQISTINFDKNGFPLAPATVRLFDNGRELKLIISKQGRVRYE